MASPPRMATSPPYPMNASLPNPKKRGPSLQLGMGKSYLLLSPTNTLCTASRHILMTLMLFSSNKPLPPPHPAAHKGSKTTTTNAQIFTGHPPKRRKGGNAGSISGSATSSAHPLRQTSFPPEETAGDNALRSPSVESDFTGVQSAVTANTGVGGGKKRKPGGGGKGKKAQLQDGTQSVKSGGPRGATRGGHRATSAQTTAAAAAAANDYDDDLDDDLDDDDDTLPTTRHDDPDRKAEREKLGLLVDALNKEQFERYEMFRRIKFRKETVRKITNYVVSQSVPPSVVLTVNGVAKTFVGCLVERAREVQREAMVAASKRKGKGGLDAGRAERENGGLFGSKGNNGPVDPARMVVGRGGTNGTAVGRDGEGWEEEGLEHMGPLLPDHLREALRRYKRDGEGGGTGLAGVSVGLGVQGTAAARLQGKRLFS